MTDELTTDRSGRTLKDYREMYWAERKRNEELEAQVDELKGFIQGVLDVFETSPAGASEACFLFMKGSRIEADIRKLLEQKPSEGE